MNNNNLQIRHRCLFVWVQECTGSERERERWERWGGPEYRTCIGLPQAGRRDVTLAKKMTRTRERKKTEARLWKCPAWVCDWFLLLFLLLAFCFQRSNNQIPCDSNLHSDSFSVELNNVDVTLSRVLKWTKCRLVTGLTMKPSLYSTIYTGRIYSANIATTRPLGACTMPRKEPLQFM